MRRTLSYLPTAIDFVGEGFIPGVYGWNLHLCYGALLHFCRVVYLFIGEGITYIDSVSVDLVRHYAVDQYIPHHFIFYLFRVPSLLDHLLLFSLVWVFRYFGVCSMSPAFQRLSILRVVKGGSVGKLQSLVINLKKHMSNLTGLLCWENQLSFLFNLFEFFMIVYRTCSVHFWWYKFVCHSHTLFFVKYKE